MKNQREFFMSKSRFGLHIIWVDIMCLLPLQPATHYPTLYCHTGVDSPLSIRSHWCRLYTFFFCRIVFDM